MVLLTAVVEDDGPLVEALIVMTNDDAVVERRTKYTNNSNAAGTKWRRFIERLRRGGHDS
jgi:hypothetical protein